MKNSSRLIFCIAFFFCCLQINAQQVGFSASVLGYFPSYNPIYYQTLSFNREIGHVGVFSPGIRIEGNYILPGYRFPVTSYNGFGISYFFPIVDSALFRADLKNGQAVDVLGTAKNSYAQIGLRCGYEIPQEFNDFLLLHAGFGMGMMTRSRTNIIPDRTNTFQYDQTDFSEATFKKVKSRSIGIELLVGGTYEFEHFSAIAQYSLIFGLSADQNTNVRYRHGLSVGIFYPIKTLGNEK